MLILGSVSGWCVNRSTRLIYMQYCSVFPFFATSLFAHVNSACLILQYLRLYAGRMDVSSEWRRLSLTTLLTVQQSLSLCCLCSLVWLYRFQMLCHLKTLKREIHHWLASVMTCPLFSLSHFQVMECHIDSIFIRYLAWYLDSCLQQRYVLCH